jgi:hypothetical protein
LQAQRPSALRFSERWTPLASVFWTGLFDFLERLFDVLPSLGCGNSTPARRALKGRWRWPVSRWRRHVFLRECDASLHAQFAGWRAGRFAFFLISLGSFNYFPFRHDMLLY